MKTSLLVSILAAFFLSACVGGNTQIIKDLKRQIESVDSKNERASEVLKSIILEDLKEARRSAKVHGDVIAFNCWDGLTSVLDSFGGKEFFTDTSKGVLSTYQKARNIRRIVDNGLPPEVGAFCSYMIQDSASVILGLGRRLGLGGGFPLPLSLPGLPGLSGL